ncbi:hypothetical protein ATO12_00330 [Aquimarina atlantica]|uniref:Uncharacterized protein n=1 Tax=Aquimarina atlantica TaxID=1317122 RepID=A0A023BYW4_9FLAO|nr:hypothetical protein [Aquimarina atlantica]EZH75256.1 hypothetical protein ATO12_00330 [Aquimarina atlantica]
MKKNSLLAFIILCIISCGEKKILDKSFEIEKPDLMYGGMIVSTNPFQIERENGERYIRKKGGVGGINLANPELEKLYGADISVTDSTKAILIIDFPLKKQIGYEIQNDNGFNRKDLVIELSKAYSEIYSEKNEYGICCDDLSDLELKMIMVFEVDGKIYLESKVESKK